MSKMKETTLGRDTKLSKAQEPIRAENIRRMRFGEQFLENNHGYWTEKDVHQLDAMFYDGIGISEMALELGRTERTVVQKLNLLKLYGVKNQRRQKDNNTDCLCTRCYKYAVCKIPTGAGQLYPTPGGLE